MRTGEQPNIKGRGRRESGKERQMHIENHPQISLWIAYSSKAAARSHRAAERYQVILEAVSRPVDAYTAS